MPIFSGSYSPSDISFLLRPIHIEMTSVERKEELIQSGKVHYSEMLSHEPAPSPEHIHIYEQALKNGEGRLAKEVMLLAKQLILAFPHKPIVLASLVRAGVPLGVMLHRLLKRLGHESYHYGISIIRDRGIDEKALSEIEQKHGTENIVFVDGWTGKGSIAGQLKASLSERVGYPECPHLVVLADPCAMAWMSASHDDWLIPFGILGASVSGLISRSVWSDKDYHGCMICDHLADFECGTVLVDRIAQLQENIEIESLEIVSNDSNALCNLNQLSKSVISHFQEKYKIEQINRIKPGIAEATRAVLRRMPEYVLIRDLNDPDVELLVYLAKVKGITIQEVGKELGQYRAATIIKKVF